MRGPLLSGPLGTAASLRQLADRLRGHGPVVVVRSLWLATALATELRVIGLIPAAERSPARKALRKATSRAGVLAVALTGGALPLAPAAVGALVLEDLVTDGEGAAVALGRVLPLLRQGGLVVSADRTREPGVEADLAEVFLAAGLTHISQDRPREGALLTAGRSPHPAVLGALG